MSEFQGEDDWLEDLCAEALVFLEHTPVHGGELAVGDRVRVLGDALEAGQQSWAGRVVQARAIAAGFKGTGAFRKRIWVAVLVEDEAGIRQRLMARDLEALLER